jgi:hypothetical protein
MSFAGLSRPIWAAPPGLLGREMTTERAGILPYVPRG